MMFPIFNYYGVLNEKMLDSRPPTLYSIMDAMANFGKTEKVKIKDLPSHTRSQFFDFDYPSSIPKEELEKKILQKFIYRRIGFETVTHFKIALDVKMNEIMPNINILYDSVKDWNLFSDGEILTRNLDRSDNSNTTAKTSTVTSTSGSNTSDRRFSESPQNLLADVRDGKYVSDYNYDTENSTSDDNSVADSTGVSEANANEVEVTSRTQADKIRNYSEFLAVNKNIYKIIFEELNELFYLLEN